MYPKYGRAFEREAGIEIRPRNLHLTRVGPGHREGGLQRISINGDIVKRGDGPIAEVIAAGIELDLQALTDVRIARSPVVKLAV
jgi:hypothetical protein